MTPCPNTLGSRSPGYFLHYTPHHDKVSCLFMISKSVKSETSSVFHCYSPSAWSHLWHLVGIQKNMGRNKFLEIQKAEVSHVVHRSYLGEAECSLQSLRSCSLPLCPPSSLIRHPPKSQNPVFLRLHFKRKLSAVLLGVPCCHLSPEASWSENSRPKEASE